MAFREVAVTEIREVLRAWLSGQYYGRWLRRRGWTARRPAGDMAAAVAAWLAREGGSGQLSDELIGRSRRRSGLAAERKELVQLLIGLVRISCRLGILAPPL
jgi:hypothetical protein